ncbi:hypothetical protein Tco_0188515 [Tanacetum coccineum]
MRTRSQSRNLHHQQHQAPPPVVEPFNLEEPLENPPPPLAPMDDQRTLCPKSPRTTLSLSTVCLTSFKTSNSLDMTKKILMPTSDISTRSLLR